MEVDINLFENTSDIANKKPKNLYMHKPRRVIMSLQSISNAVNSVRTQTPANTKKQAQGSAVANENKTENKVGFSQESAVYEKSSEKVDTKVTPKKDHAAIVAQMKADAEARQNQLMDIVRQTMKGQGNALATADDVWKFLASGNFTVSEAARAKAQEDISENGYWGVKQTSDRILEFAKALAGDDPSKAESLFAAFKKGFEQATGTWGKELPKLCQDTYKAVEEKFQAWINEGKSSSGDGSTIDETV